MPHPDPFLRAGPFREGRANEQRGVALCGEAKGLRMLSCRRALHCSTVNAVDAPRCSIVGLVVNSEVADFEAAIALVVASACCGLKHH